MFLIEFRLKGVCILNNYQEVVQKIMRNNVPAQAGSLILLVTDESTAYLAENVYEALLKEEWKADLISMADRSKSGEEPPAYIAEKMLQYDIVFCLTKHSLTHTLARRNANEKGISVITMPGINEEMFLYGAINADYRRIEEETVEMAAKITAAQAVEIYTGENHRLVIPIKERTGIASTGVFREKGASGNLPSGEAYVAPIEGEAEGTIAINGSIAGIGLLKEAIILTIKEGRLMEATTSVGEKLLQLLGDGDGRLLCELGIGTNYAARITGNILEDEKAYDTIHIAFGSNHTFGGTIQTNVHIDCVTRKPRIKWIS